MVYGWCRYHPFRRAPTLLSEGNSKNGADDSTSGSLVFPYSKGKGAGDRPLPEPIYKPNLNLQFGANLKSNISKSAYQL